MTKKLILKRRGSREIQEWHDAFPLGHFLEKKAEGMPFNKAALWFQIAGKVELAKEDEGQHFDRSFPDIEVELSNQEARVLWNNMIKAPSEWFGRNRATLQPAVPPPGKLALMMADFAQQLGFEMPTVPDDGDDDDDE